MTYSIPEVFLPASLMRLSYERRGCDEAKLFRNIQTQSLVFPSSAGSTFLARVGVHFRMTDSGTRSHIFGAAGFSNALLPLLSDPFFALITPPNKALEPTTMSVTHPACAGCAPDTVAAHL